MDGITKRCHKSVLIRITFIGKALRYAVAGMKSTMHSAWKRIIWVEKETPLVLIASHFFDIWRLIQKHAFLMMFSSSLDQYEIVRRWYRFWTNITYINDSPLLSDQEQWKEKSHLNFDHPVSRTSIHANFQRLIQQTLQNMFTRTRVLLA